MFQPNPAFAVFGSLTQSSRAPSAIELGCADPESPCRLPNAMAGDPPLNQVVTQSVEGGVRGLAGDALRWSVAAFRGDSKDDILFVADDQAGFGYFRNFGKTRRQGIELNADTRIAAWTFGLHYTYLDATYRSEETVNGEGNSSNEGPAPGFEGEIDISAGDRIPLIPRQILKLSAQWDVLPQLSVMTDVAYVGGAPVRGNENGEHEPDGVYYLGEGSYGGHTLLNLGAEWRPVELLTVYVQIDNVLDREYSTSGQLGAAPFTANGNFEVPAVQRADHRRRASAAVFDVLRAGRAAQLSGGREVPCSEAGAHFRSASDCSSAARSFGSASTEAFCPAAEKFDFSSLNSAARRRRPTPTSPAARSRR